MANIIPLEKIESKILLISEQKVMLDYDLAKLYGVSTKRLNEQVKRNIKRFPEDFMFRLTKYETEYVVANCDHLKNLKYSYQLPWVFTEQGVAMLSSVLNSKKAIEVNITIMRTFVKIRRMSQSYKDLARKIAEIEKKYNKKIIRIFEVLDYLIDDKKGKDKKEIGFKCKQK
ncbi:ORF6N domain-containing protein [Candidatus Parcubacteria bacterium]|nr:ORF6N domain-containing protein [Candidatus Parcubacteria bacterium]